ncbi:helix-turn-helix transcriptional regulator [Paenibacillus tritici]|uniref:helix-turn-helix transcriptional regulator n=1 Tax=Paenibacillus tritici TaxID=1873425 RepID=UPI00248474B3|nr:helix-turn-helix transcriptional regulator [Paenibacillus tritici]
MKVVIPDSLMGEIQELQDTFGSVTGQAIVLTDQAGNVVTRPTLFGIFYQKMFNSLQGMDRPFEPALLRIGPLSHPAVLEEWVPGLKYVVSPLVPDYGQTYYLWSGLYMEEGTRELVLQAFEAKMRNHPYYEMLRAEVTAMPELSREGIGKIRRKLSALGNILSKLLAGCVLKPLEQRRDLVISQLLSNLEKEFLKIEVVLQQMAGAFSDAELYAFAQEEEAGQFTVKYCAGKEANLLMDAGFQQGDGFLGQAVLGREPRHWQGIAKDPRSIFFSQRGMTQPECLSCYPVQIHSGKKALLLAIAFGATRQIQDFAQHEQNVAALLGVSGRGERLMQREALRNEATQRLKEAARLLPQAVSTQELGNGVLDMIMGMPFSPSSVLVFFEELTGGTHYAKGWRQEEIAPYIRDLQTRYSSQAFLSSAIIHDETGGQALLECPLITDQVFKGILSVGFRRRSEAEEWLSFTDCLASLASTSIRLIEKDSRHTKQAEVLLDHTLQYLHTRNPELHRLCSEAASMAYELARYTGLPEREAEQMRTAGLLAPFKLDVLLRYGFYPEEISLLKQVDQFASFYFTMNKPSVSVSAQLLALVLHHIGQSADKELLADTDPQWLDPSRFSLDEYVARELHSEPRTSFQSFLRSRSAAQPERSGISAAKLLNSTALKTPKEEWGISPREEEVLELIILGKTNREIASTLFISEHTVKNHLSRIFHKMDVTDRSQIIALVYKRMFDSERIETS